MAGECVTDSESLIDTAVRVLKASTLGKARRDEDVNRLRACAESEEQGSDSDELACYILMREVRKRRQATMPNVVDAS